MTRIIAIDGPSGVGKGTTSALLAEALDTPVLDTGAMYRALAWLTLDRGIDPDDGEALAELARDADLHVRRRGTRLEVLLDGEPVEAKIRTNEVSDRTSRISTHAALREQMVALQRREASQWGAIVEGRDIGTVVFPDTPFKFYLDAPINVRAERRHRELLGRGEAVDFAVVLEEVSRRDLRDSQREASPLRVDESYQVIDTSDLTPQEVAERMLHCIRDAEGD